MKTVALTALLLLTGAFAQTSAQTSAQTPAPSTAPSGQPVAPAQAAPVLTLSAPVGQSLELNTTATSRLRLTDVQAAAAPGRTISAATLARVRREAQTGLQQLGAQPATTISGKAFLKVTARDAAGTTTLVSTVVQNLPARGGARPQAISIRTTQTVAPDGQVRLVSLTSDNPQVAAAFKSLTPAQLQQYSQQGNSSLGSGVYGTPLVAGQPRTTTATLDAQTLLGNIIGAFAGPSAQTSIQASPLEYTTTTTYQGRSAQGLETFGVSGSFKPWQLSVKVPGAAGKQAASGGTLNLTLANARTTGQQVYRADGLPTAQTQNTTMQIRMTLPAEDGVLVTVTMTMEQAMTMKAR